MKYFLALILLLTSISASFAQVASKLSPASAATQTNSMVGLPPSASLSADTTKKMTELDYYKKLAEQAKDEADRAHGDIMTGYTFNAGILVTVTALILAIQLIDVKSKIAESERFVRDNVNNVNNALIAMRSSNANELQGLWDAVNTNKRTTEESLSSQKEEFNKENAKALQAADRAHMLINGYSLFDKGHYLNALQVFLNIAEKELSAGKIEDNTGFALYNCVFKTEELYESDFVRAMAIKSYFEDAKSSVYPVLQDVLGKKSVYRHSGSPVRKEYIQNPPKST